LEQSRLKKRLKEHAKKLWRDQTAAFVAIPLVLGAIEWFAQDEHLRFLLFPSVGAIAYKLFTDPAGSHATWRGAVIAPTVGAAIGTLGANAFAPGFVGVALISVLTMAIMRLLDVTVPSVMALAILPLVFSPELVTLWYPPAVLLATVMLFLMFLGMRRTLPADE
jgi:uncharacterized membrane protein YhaH (DUF805 family)